MVRPTFFIYDTFDRYNKHVPYNGNPLSRIPIDEVVLPENGAFWFYTGITKELENIDLDSFYVHLFPGITSTAKKTFNKEPVIVTHDMMKYNPKTKLLEVRNSKWPFSKPIWTKNCTYYGDKLTKPVSALGRWYFDSYTENIYFILSSTSNLVS